MSTFDKTFGAPLWEGHGAAHLFEPKPGNFGYRWFEQNPFDASGSSGRNWRPGFPDIALRDTTVTGGLGTDEFGASMIVADFTCDGYDDLAVGAPGADFELASGTIQDAGAVYIYRGGPAGIPASGSITIYQGVFGSEGEPETNDRFGEVLAVGNVNGRRVTPHTSGPKFNCWDLLVGTPNEDSERGEVQIFYGDSLSPVQIGPRIHADDLGVHGPRGIGDRFGAAIISYPLNLDGFHDVAIGAPGEVGGRVFLVPSDSAGTGLDLASTVELAQDGGAAEDEVGDDFGAALTATRVNQLAVVVVGVPGENSARGEVTSFQVQLGWPDTGNAVFLDRMSALDSGYEPKTGDRWGSKLLAPRAFPVQPWKPIQ